MAAMDSLVACGHCGAKNRLKIGAKGQNPICGKCRSRLAPELATPDHLIEVNDSSFTKAIEKYPGAAMVSFGAQWCGHSKRIVPALQQLARQYSGRVKMATIDVDQSPATASRFNVRSTPTLIFFKSGRQVDTVTGALPKAEIERRIKSM